MMKKYGDIILIGFMGTGKTTVGLKLAHNLARTFLDTDDLIEELAGKSIPSIFAEEGEEHFRFLETRSLEGLDKYSRGELVLSTGGGAVLREENVHLLSQRGVMVLLTASVEEIYKRASHTDRPLLQDEEPRRRIEKMLGEREPVYRQAAQFSVNTDEKGPLEISEEIHGLLEQKGYI